MVNNSRFFASLVIVLSSIRDSEGFVLLTGRLVWFVFSFMLLLLQFVINAFLEILKSFIGSQQNLLYRFTSLILLLYFTSVLTLLLLLTSKFTVGIIKHTHKNKKAFFFQVEVSAFCLKLLKWGSQILIFYQFAQLGL